MARGPALLDGVELLPAARQNLVRIGLMAHVPDQSVIGGVKYIMQGDCQLDGTQSRGKMTPAGADAVDQEIAQFRGQLYQLGGRQAAQIRRRINGFEQGIGFGRHDHLRQFILRHRSGGKRPHPMLQICTRANPLT